MCLQSKSHAQPGSRVMSPDRSQSLAMQAQPAELLCWLAGMAYIILFSKWLLPGDQAADDLTSALYVPAKSRAAGKTAKESGLSGGKVAITGISKQQAPAQPYTPELVVEAGDTIYVTGELATLGFVVNTHTHLGRGGTSNT